MRLPSLGNVVAAARQSARRFPLVLVAGAVTAYAAISLVEGAGDERMLTRLITTASLGLPLLFALTVVAERRAVGRLAHWLTLGAGVATLAGFWLAFPRWTSDGQAFRYTQFSVAFHLFVAFAPFAGYREPNAFWQYNKGLLLRFLTAGIYSGVLWFGLAGALLALNKLFGVDVPNEGYARLWFVFAFVFNTWFFVGGVPHDLGALEQDTDYPTGLRVFTQYVLVPIVVLYLIILTIYLGKVVATRQWPSGWIGYLVSSVASVGILSWLLVHPLEERAEYAWVKTFTRWLYVAMMPAIVMLWLAIWQRVGQYGITERRYFLIVLSVWLAGVAVYYTLSRSRSIKLIPATLCAISLLTVAGPWSAYAVSRRSQMGRLEVVLARNGLLVDGALRPATRQVTDADAREISAGFRYLLEMHGASAVAPWLADSLRRTVGAVGGGNAARADAGVQSITTAMHVRYVGRWEGGTSGFFNYHSERQPGAVRIEGYTYAIRLPPGLVGDSLMITDDVHVRATVNPLLLVVTRAGARVLEVSLQPVLDSAAAYRGRHPAGAIPPELMTVEVHQGRGAALVRLTQVGGTNARPARLTSIEGDLFLRLP